MDGIASLAAGVIVTVPLLAQLPDPFNTAIASGSVGMVCMVGIFLLHREALRAFREELAAERKNNAILWRRIYRMVVKQHVLTRTLVTRVSGVTWKAGPAEAHENKPARPDSGGSIESPGRGGE